MKIFFITSVRLRTAFLLLLFAGSFTNGQAQVVYWGTTASGGTNGQGTLYSMNADGSSYNVIHNFGGQLPDGSNDLGNPTGSLVQRHDTIFGVAQNGNNIFIYNTTTGTYNASSVLNDIGVYSPTGIVNNPTDGKLYGLANSGGSDYNGAVFSYDPVTGTATDEFDFVYGNSQHSGGMNPVGSLTLFHGKFYGFTQSGGANYNGTLFSFDPVTKQCAKIYDMPSGTGISSDNGNYLAVINDVLYGVIRSGGPNSGSGYLFSYNDASGAFADIFDFTGNNTAVNPVGVVAYNNVIYGVTSGYTGNNTDPYGTIFSFNPSTAAYTQLFSFDGAAQGASPSSNITLYSGQLFGNTNSGGANGAGTVFRYGLATHGVSVLHNFSGGTADGANPQYNPVLVPAVSPRFWGMTAKGGDNGQGALFTMNTDGSDLKIAYSFKPDASGYSPYGTAAFYNGMVYGVARSGGAQNDGVVFSFDPAAGTYTKIHDFDGVNGSLPDEGLTANTDGLLYGITESGGSNQSGVIYSINPSTGAFTKVFDMATATGSQSVGPLTLYNSKLYGLTSAGGKYGNGVFFSFDPATGTYTDLHDYQNHAQNDAFLQSPGHLVIYDNTLYGVSVSGNGELFSYKNADSVYTTLYSFSNSGTAQYDPVGIVLNNNIIYGINHIGGIYGYGGLFSFDPVSSVYKEVMNLTQASGGSSQGNIVAYNNNFYGIGSTGIYLVSPDGGFIDLDDFSVNELNNAMYGTLLLVDASLGTTLQTVSVPNGITKVYGDADFDPGAVANSRLPVTYKSGNTNIAVINGSAIHITGAGIDTITVSQSGNSLYAAATDVTFALTVSPASLLIAAADTIKNEDQPNPVFRIIYKGFVNHDTAASLVTPAVAVTTADISSPRGKYPITISGASSPNYNITYQYPPDSLTIIGKLQVFTITDTVKTYGDADFAIGTSNSGLSFTYKADSADIAADAGNGKLHIVNAGITRVIVQQAGNAEWAPQTDTVFLRVSQAPLTITALDTTIIYGRQNPVFTFAYHGFVNGEGPSALTAIPMIASTAPSSGYANPGTYLIEASGAISKNYAFTYINGVYTVILSADQMNGYCNAPGSLTVNILSTKTRKAGIIVYSLAGQKVLYSDVSLQNGFNQFVLPVNLSTGVYVIKVEGDSDSLQLGQKVMITR